MPSRDKDSYSIQSVENALDVLEALCDEEGEVRISRLSEKLQMNKTSVFRLLATFESRGYVERKKGSGKYQLGLSAYEIGQKLISRMGLLKEARPVIERFVRDCDEAVYVTVQRGNEVLFLDLIDTSQQVKIVSLVGKRFPLINTAPGQIILTYSQTLNSKTDNNLSASLPQAEEIRLNGYVCESGGLGDGICCIATPLLGTNGELSGSLCLVGPDFRLNPEKIDSDLLSKLKETSNIISSKLGFHQPYITRRRD